MERAVFGESASSQDLERIAAVEVEYQQLQDDYLTLSEEFDKLKDQPPVVIEKEDKRATFLEEQLGRMQEQYQAMQLKLNKMRVEHLELQTAHQELRDSFAIVKAEAEKKEKELTTQLRVLREKHARVAQELQELRSSHVEAQRQVTQLKEEKLKLLKDLQEQQEQAQNIEQLRSDYESLLGSFHCLQEENEKLVEKSNRFRTTMADTWTDPNQVNSTPKGGGLLPPLTPNSRCPTPISTPQTPKSDLKIGLEEFSKEVRFPASLLEPNGPLSVTQLKTRLMEIRGRVHYFNDSFQETRDPSRRNTFTVYDVDAH